MATPTIKSHPELAQTAILLLAAGSSQRMGGKIADKCLFPLRGKILLSYAYEAFQSIGNWQEIVIVYRDEAQQKLLAPYFSPAVTWVSGATTRALSVFNALEYLHRQATPPRWVLIHDGARPYIAQELIEKIFLETLKKGSAIPAKEVTDTLVQKDSLQGIYHYPRRQDYLRVETPQGFTFSLLYQAYRSQLHDLSSFTDDSAIYQTQSPLHFVVHPMRNDKITFAEELQYC
ncbi:MAG: 2-C-methyl-D-erythritol 4-phosphate cytidylyltransferase [Puniceicoccales bacterium]|jgi:2-C-methyl-D-erythritol 4-phosphate cytidylyltransferase|nr:2-C-methyl-D-erythritol 4-phosphate cytidylyltransferase [Puniceicoccales bacterium]